MFCVHLVSLFSVFIALTETFVFISFHCFLEIHIQTGIKSTSSQTDGQTTVEHRILRIQADQSVPTRYLDEESGKIIEVRKSETEENMIDIERNQFCFWFPFDLLCNVHVIIL
jgi:hypothetical protein